MRASLVLRLPLRGHQHVLAGSLIWDFAPRKAQPPFGQRMKVLQQIPGSYSPSNTAPKKTRSYHRPSTSWSWRANIESNMCQSDVHGLAAERMGRRNRVGMSATLDTYLVFEMLLGG